MDTLVNPDEVVLRNLLERNAAERPDVRLVLFDDDSAWTNREALEAASAAANSLRAAGVRRGDRVAVFLPNGPDFLRAWWGVSVLGAVTVPINTALRGDLLRRLMDLSRPVALVTNGENLPRFGEVTDLGALIVLTPDELRGGDRAAPPLEEPLGEWDDHVLMLTSGTTGPSKLARQSYLHSYEGGSWVIRDQGCGVDDVFQIDIPLFHGGALWHVHTALGTRTGLSVRQRPSLDAYWEVARDTGATVGLLLSTMTPYLLGQPVRPAEREHRLRLMLSSPLPADPDAFVARFGVERLVTAYGMTEVATCLGGVASSDARPGYCGRLRPGFAVRLADEHDHEVPIGEIGQVLVRTDRPWMISTEYVGNPEATAAVWRNGWFHTGDLMRCDPDGNFYFVDREKDALRRRGENISSYEVEAVVASHPAVSEAACVPERSGVAVDDEVKVWIVPASPGGVDFEELLRFCTGRLPHFMVPRYFELIDALPKTPTTKVAKYLLRQRGNSAETWDREAHGLTVTRQGLQTAGSPSP